MKFLGIDIGTCLIKVVELQTTSRGPQITNYFEHRLSMAANADHTLETIEFMRSLLQSYDPSQIKVCFGLKHDRVSIRHKFFPFNDRLKINRSLPFELEEDIPFSPDNAIFDAKVIRYLGQGAEVLACAAPKQQVEKAIQLAQDCGFQTSILSDEAIAFANLFESWSEAPPHVHSPITIDVGDDQEKPVLEVDIYVNIGHTRTIVSAIHQKRLLAVRSILWGGQNIAEALAKKYNIPAFEAQKEFENKAFILTSKTGASFDQVNFSDTIAASVREMLRDLQLTLLDLNAEFNTHVSSVKITGGASQIKNLGPYMTQTLEVPVNKLDTLEHFANPLIGKTPELIAKIGPALGLALECLKKPRNPALNFLRGEFAPQNHTWQNFKDRWGTTAKFAGYFFLVLLTYSYLRESFTLNLAEKGKEVLRTQARQVAGLKGKAASEGGIRSYIQKQKKAAADFKRLEGLSSMNSALDILLKVSNTVPSKQSIQLDIKELSVQDELLSLQGYVNSPRELTILEQALTNLAKDGKVTRANRTLPAITDRVAFALSLQVDRETQKGK
ncbi:MAG: pilus assembly protein PilM [Bdellovibrionia bacterium]